MSTSLELLRELERNRDTLSRSEVALLELGKTSVEGFTQLAAKLIEGAFTVAAHIASSPPISQAIAIGSGLVALSWFCNSYPNLAASFHIEELCKRLTAITSAITDPKSAAEISTLQGAATKCKADLQAAGIDDPFAYFMLNTVISATEIQIIIIPLLNFIATGPLVDWLWGSLPIERIVDALNTWCRERLRKG